jgi:hypothetical protein
MFMVSGKRSDSSAKAMHVADSVGQDGITQELRPAGNQTASESLMFYLRVKPDRRRVKAVYPPHLERRRNWASS